MSSEENSVPTQVTEAVPELQIELPIPAPDAADAAEIENLLASAESVSPVPVGQVVSGKVIKVTDTEVVVSVGESLEGAVPVGEFQTSDGAVTVSPGDETDVWVESFNAKQGTVRISRLKAARRKAWEKIEQAFEQKTTMTGRVTEHVKGGLAVDIGIPAFLPASHADLTPLKNLDPLIGQEIPCKVIKLIKKRTNVVVSRKLALEDEVNRRKAELISKLTEGAELVGQVKNLTDYGAFISLGPLDGLLHITDLSWDRVKHPSEVLQVGQEIKVKVLKYDAEKGRVSLGLKQFTPDPWERAVTAYHVGDRKSGRVVSVTDYGAFVELDPGVEGLIHVSEMTWSKRPKHPSKIVKVGDRVEVDVLDVNAEKRRISLSLKQTLPDPWAGLEERYQMGSSVEATIKSLTDFGAFAEIEEGVEGLIHISDLSWNKKIKHPSEAVKKGEKIKAVVLNIDLAQRRLSLGLKQLERDPWENFISAVQVGDIVKGKVMRIATFGAFVELAEGIEGLCHKSELGSKPPANGGHEIEVGAETEFRVIRIEPTEKKIGLSRKALTEPAKTTTPDKKRGDRASSAKAEAPKPETRKSMTTMAEALSAAGITSSGGKVGVTLSAPEEPSAEAVSAAGEHPIG